MVTYPRTTLTFIRRSRIVIVLEYRTWNYSVPGSVRCGFWKHIKYNYASGGTVNILGTCRSIRGLLNHARVRGSDSAGASITATTILFQTLNEDTHTKYSLSSAPTLGA